METPGVGQPKPETKVEPGEFEVMAGSPSWDEDLLGAVFVVKDE